LVNSALLSNSSKESSVPDGSDSELVKRLRYLFSIIISFSAVDWR